PRPVWQEAQAPFASRPANGPPGNSDRPGGEWFSRLAVGYPLHCLLMRLGRLAGGRLRAFNDGEAGAVGDRTVDRALAGDFHQARPLVAVQLTVKRHSHLELVARLMVRFADMAD